MAAAICHGSRGGGAAVTFHHQVGAYNTQTLRAMDYLPLARTAAASSATRCS